MAMSDQAVVALIIGITTVTNGVIAVIGQTIKHDLKKQGVPTGPASTGQLIEGMAIELREVHARLDRAVLQRQDDWSGLIAELESHLAENGNGDH